ncbi:MAG: SPOR domain-containing protein [Desulfobulbaceae bacterium]|nr:SPOR domain-containing protein [Desulfobulbaceae bacterium]
MKGKYFVQVGSFADIENARRLVREIAETGKKVYLRNNSKRQKAFYQVLVHGGSSLTGARSVQTAMIQTGFPNAFVVSGSN